MPIIFTRPQKPTGWRAWFPATAGNIIVAVIGAILAGLLAWLTPRFFMSWTSQCGDEVTTYGPFYSQGVAYIGLIVAILLLILGLNRFPRWWYKLIALIAYAFFFVVAAGIAWSHALDGLCF